MNDRNESAGLNQQMDRESGVDVVEGSALATLNRSEIDMQISTAKRYPRSIARAKQKMIEMATIDKETAAKCRYTLKRKNGDGDTVKIEGPSVRLAEIAAACWGNIRFAARVLGEDGHFIVAQGVCHDLETNAQVSVEVRRRIHGKRGRYSDDMIGVTANAAAAIALRNAILTGIPRAYIQPAYEAAMKTSLGDQKAIGDLRRNCLGAFKAMGVDLKQIMTFLEKPDGGVEDITSEDLLDLQGVYTGIKDGDTTVEESFPKTADAPKTAGKAETSTSDLNQQLDEKKTRQSKKKESEQSKPEQTGTDKPEEKQVEKKPDQEQRSEQSQIDPIVEGYKSADADQRPKMLLECARKKNADTKRSELDGALFKFCLGNGLKKVGDIPPETWAALHRAVWEGRFDFKTGHISREA